MKALRAGKLRGFWTGDVTRKSVAHILKSLPMWEKMEGLSDLDLISLDINPMDYTDAASFRDDYLAVSLLSKYPGLALGIDREAVAYESFVAADIACDDTNCRLQSSSPDWGVDAVLHTAQRKIARLLGKFDWDQASKGFGFSNGASTRLRRRDAASPYKFSSRKGKLHVTRDALPLAIAAVRSSDRWVELLTNQLGENPINWFSVVVGNAVTTVPKNAKTDRIIAKEPCMNMYLQRGLGSLIRRRLKRVGIDLDSQCKNQQLALVGSRTGELATIDLKAASDSVSLELCRLLLPSDWFEAVMLTRSHYGVLPDGTFHRYSKVSSMGNGFTFELESLLFWAITSSVLEVESIPDHRVAVFGDDIICNVAGVPLLEKALGFCGFTFNDEKSFRTGPFRESCGKHYFNGVDVTPFYVRKTVDSVFRLYWLLNSYRRWATGLIGFGLADSYAVWRKLRSFIPKRWQSLTVPDGVGDGGILCTLAEARPRFRNQRYVGCRIVGVSKQYTPGDELMYLDQLSRSKSSNKSTRSVVHNERYDALESIMLDRAIPDAYQLNRYAAAVWQDPGFFTES